MRAVTKTGYYAPDKSAPIDPRRQTMIDLSEAAHSTIPLNELDMQISSVVRHPDTQTTDVTVVLQSRDLGWQATDNGKSIANVTVAVASLTGSQQLLASRVERLALQAPTQDPTHLEKLVTPLHLTMRTPRKTQSIRVVVETANGGRIGAAGLDRKALDAAPIAPTPQPRLVPPHSNPNQPSGFQVQ
jgi:hypothetical protein